MTLITTEYIDASDLLNLSHDDLRKISAKEFVAMQNELADKLNALYEKIGANKKVSAPYWTSFDEERNDTAYQYVVAELYSCYSDLYKEMNNFRPRLQGWESLTIEQLMFMIDDLNE